MEIPQIFPGIREWIHGDHSQAIRANFVLFLEIVHSHDSNSGVLSDFGSNPSTSTIDSHINVIHIITADPSRCPTVIICTVGLLDFCLQDHPSLLIYDSSRYNNKYQRPIIELLCSLLLLPP